MIDGNHREPTGGGGAVRTAGAGFFLFLFLCLTATVGLAIVPPASAGEPVADGAAALSDAAIFRSAVDALAAVHGARGDDFRRACEQGDWDDAEHFLATLIDQNPETGEANGLRGLVRLNRYHVHEALEDFIAAQTVGRMNRSLKGVVQRAKRVAERILEEAEETGLDPSYLALLRDVRTRSRAFRAANDPIGLEAFLGNVFVYESIRADAALQRGFLRLARGDVAGAEEDFRLAEQSGPGESARIDLAIGRRLAEEIQAASGTLDDTAALSPLIGNLPDVPWVSTVMRLDFAQELLQARRYDWLKRVTEQLRARNPDGREFGRLLSYEGEVAWNDGRFDDAKRDFETALELITARYLRANLLFRLAECHAKLGDFGPAVELAEEAADLVPGQDWMQQRVGAFLIDLDRDKGIARLDKARELATTRGDKARSYAALADIHQKMGDEKKYLEYAALYVAEIDAMLQPVDPALRAMADYYQGELAMARADLDEAYNQYSRATREMANRHRLSEIYMKLSDIDSTRGDVDGAVANALRSAEALPNQPWKLRQVGMVLLRHGVFDTGEEYILRSREIDPSPASIAAALTALAEGFRQGGRVDDYRRYAREYVDFVAGGEGADPSREGLDDFFRAEMLNADGDAEQAIEHYRRAALLIRDPIRLSEIYLTMAQLLARRGERDAAVEAMEKSTSFFPEQVWKLRQAGDFYLDLGMTDVALARYSHALSLAGKPSDRAALYAGIAECHRRDRNPAAYLAAAAQYVAAVDAPDSGLLPDASGLYSFYRGELLDADGRFEEARAAYEQAAELVKNPVHLSEAYLKLARYHARDGNRVAASEYMDRSVALFPQQVWKLRQAGDFYLDLNLPDLAIRYYTRALEVSAGAADQPPLYMGMAESYLKKRDADQYLAYAGRYIDAVAERGDDAAPEEKGMRAYYQAELHAAAGRPEEAMREYAVASTLLVNPVQLSDIYIKLARLHAAAGDKEKAVGYVEKSVSYYPDKSWKLRQAGEVYFRLDELEKAIEHFERALQYAPEASTDAVASNGELAEIHKRLRQRDKYLHYAEKYIEAAAVHDGSLTAAARGLRAYYQGEIHSAREEPQEANAAYEQAARFFSDNPTRLSDSYMRMAEYQHRFGSRDLAIEYGEKAAALLPESFWRLQEAGDLFRSIDGMIDRAIELYTGAVRYASSLTTRAAATSALADAYKLKGDIESYHLHAERYIELLEERGTAYSDAETGLYHYYLAEMDQGDDAPDRRFTHYETASRYVTEKMRLADIYMQMAEYQARYREVAAGVQYAEQSADLLVDYSWKLRQVGDFLARYDEMDKAFYYFDEAMKKAKTPRDEAGVHSGRADAYRSMASRVSSDQKIADPQTRARIRREMNEKFIEQARIYIDAVDGMQTDARPADRGLRWFYAGLIHQLEENEQEAYNAFETANQYLTSNSLRSETLLYMARQNVNWDNEDLAYSQACEAAGLMPGAGWRISQVSRVLVDIRQYQAAIAILCRAISLRPQDNVALYSYLADAYAKSGDKKTALFYNERYIDHLTGVIDEHGLGGVSEKLQDDLFDARNRHSSWSKSGWEFDHYIWASRKKSGSHTIGTMAEITYNFTLPNRMRGKIYGQLGGTIRGHYFGETWSFTRNRMESWQSDPGLRDSLYGLIGVRISPIRRLGDFSIGVEKVFGLGREAENDVRFRALWDQSSGTKPLPYRSHWAYTKTWVDNIYSTKERNFTSDGTFRRGVTIPWKCNRNLLFIPYVSLNYDYGGTKASHGDRFGLEGGPGLLVRRWFREDKYHAPRAYVQVNLYYRFGITSNRDNTLGLSLHTSF